LLLLRTNSIRFSQPGCRSNVLILKHGHDGVWRTLHNVTDHHVGAVLSIAVDDRRAVSGARDGVRVLDLRPTVDDSAPQPVGPCYC
jgi:hypothetical protein